MKAMIGVLLFLSSSGLIAQTALPVFELSVSIQVTGDDDLTKEVSSYLRREVRSLGDVKITDDKPFWRISVVGATVRASDSEDLGFVLAVLITSPFDNQDLDSFVKPEYLDGINSLTSGLTKVENLYVRLGPKERLGGVCASIVADFDSDYVESTRKRMQSLERDGLIQRKP